MSSPLGFERRLAALLLLLCGALPLLTTYLPQAPQGLVVPGVALGVALATLAVPVDGRAQTGAAVLGTFAAITFAVLAAQPSSLLIFFLLPLILRVVAVPAWISGGITAAGAAGLLALSLVPRSSDPFSTLSLGSTSDVIGAMALICTLGWLAVDVALSAIMRSEGRALICACETLDRGLYRDRDELLRIAALLTTEGEGLIEGQGLGPHHLNVSTAIGDQRLLLASLGGPPLATLSAAWALRAVARAGQLEPAALVDFARCHLDEIIEPAKIEWVGIYEPQLGRCRSAPAGALITPRQGAGAEPLAPFDPPLDPPAPSARAADPGAKTINPKNSSGAPNTTDALDALIDAPAPLEGASGRGEGRAIAADLLVAMALPLAFVSASVVGNLIGPSELWTGSWTGLWASVSAFLPGLVLARRDRTRARLAEIGAGIEDRIECHDDVHNRIARLHGGLLPYEIEIGEQVARAHRLRGLLLEGSFADMLVDPTGRARILAGQVSGQGIAARFLGMEAQFSLRTRLTFPRSQARSWSEQTAATVAQLGKSAAQLDFPLHFSSGLVSFGRDGELHGEGSLCELVVVEGASDEPKITDRSHVTPCTRVYLTPSASLPDPEDDAPALEATGATLRVASMIRDQSWAMGEGTLASLFSLVFDGVHAPAHGTLIEIHRTIASARDPAANGSDALTLTG